MVLISKLRRPSALAVAGLLFVASLLPLLSSNKASAYGLLGSRQIMMSSSASGATTAGQNVSYEVQFNVASDTEDIQGVVVDFCANSPIIGDACTAPTGMDVSAASLTLDAGLTNFTKDATETTAQKFVLSYDNTTAYNPGAAETLRFTLVGVENPNNVNTSFYARIITFTTDEAAEDYDSATANANNPGSEAVVIDAGGVALSTAEQITITSKVQERLTFCVYTDGNGDTTLGDPNLTTCTGVAGSSIILGDTNGVLYDSGPFVSKHAMYNVSTNASNGATIRAKSTSPHASGSLASSASFVIDAIGSGTTETDADDDGGVEQFGLCSYMDPGGGAGLTIDTVYDGVGTTNDCADTVQTAGTNTTGIIDTANGANDVTFSFISADLISTYGDVLATKPAGAQSTGILAFLGNIATTTEPGIYTATFTFIATGNY